jgi:hypothetical protein
VSDRTVDIAASGTDVYFLRTFDQKGRAQFLKRGETGTEDTVLAMDVKPSARAQVKHIIVDKETVYFASSEGPVAWEKASSLLSVVAPNPTGADQIAIDDTDIYFTGTDCTLRKVPRAGGKVIELAKTKVDYCGLTTIVVDESHVWFTIDDTIWSVAKNGKGGKRAVLPKSEHRFVMGMVLDSENVYALLSQPEPQTAGSTGKLLRIPKKGGAPVTLAKVNAVGNAWTLAADASKLYWLEAIAPNKVALSSMPKPGGERRVLAELPGLGYAISVGSSSIFFVVWEMGTGRPGARPRLLRLKK